MVFANSYASADSPPSHPKLPALHANSWNGESSELTAPSDWMHARSLMTSAGAIAQHDPQLPWSLATPVRCRHLGHWVRASKDSGRP